ncbi:MAG TPA: hypothetical protein VNK81_07890 [Thermodesulfobacteriota bacterium]|nr:hypothetical protein [Thermodesulfobacteriota bacterium]
MNILEIYQKSVYVVTYLNSHPGGGVTGPGVGLDEIARSLRLRRRDIYPVIDYLLKEGYIVRSHGSNDVVFRLTYKALTIL